MKARPGTAGADHEQLLCEVHLSFWWVCVFCLSVPWQKFGEQLIHVAVELLGAATSVGSRSGVEACCPEPQLGPLPGCPEHQGKLRIGDGEKVRKARSLDLSSLASSQLCSGCACGPDRREDGHPGPHHQDSMQGLGIFPLA